MVTRKREEIIQEIEASLSPKYPNLHVKHEQGEDFVRGSFPVRSDDTLIDRYLVEILILNDYPKTVPLVREVGGRIPCDPDRHVYPEGYLCLFLPDEQWQYWPVGSSFRDFLDNPLNDYLCAQTYFQHYGAFPFGERRHGVLGILDYYSEDLGTKDIRIIRNFLAYLCHPQPKGHWVCYCGSGKKMRFCHFSKLIDLRQKISLNVAQQSLHKVSQYIATRSRI